MGCMSGKRSCFVSLDGGRGGSGKRDILFREKAIGKTSKTFLAEGREKKGACTMARGS